jgi:hypothetical protein
MKRTQIRNPMKPVKIVILALLSFILPAYVFSQGTTCTNPHVMALNETVNTFSTSNTSGNASHCSDAAFSGTGKLTIFRFTTNASGNCVLVNFSVAPAQAAEISMYTGCSGGGSCQGIESSSSICFADGSGFWAPAETFTLSPNTTYYLRVWTAGSGTITMSAKNYSPPNNFCAGSTYIGGEETNDNNACHKGSTEVFPIHLCAFSLENTAFYSYFIESNGVSSIQLNNINCDNSNLGNSNGFQIGFFTGACGSLTKISCTTLAGGSLTAMTGSLSAGTQVWVAIDGVLGSNCSYTLTAFNAMVLPVRLKYFTAWKRTDANRLTWQTTSEKDFLYFVIEKSLDGANFIEIGTRNGKGGPRSVTSYSFDDPDMKSTQYYRLKYVNRNGKPGYSNVIKVNRDDAFNTRVIFSNMVTSQLSMRVIDLPSDNLYVKIIDNTGREMKSQNVKVNPGENNFTINTSSIPSGFYYMILSGENYRKTFPFVKS